LNNSELKNEQIWRNMLRLADRLGTSGTPECDLPSRLPLSQLRVVGVIYDRHPAGVMLKEIADELNISIHTVMSHRKNITHKTGIKSVAGLTVYALLNNLLDQNDVVL
jgi:ATP/maltotriose-dependent transcriptional regulator MalT